MAIKDPNYDRYAGIVSLPDAYGKMPRPFRVDEDGKVIYLDKERDPARPVETSNERSRAGIMDWDELDRKLDEERGVTGRVGADSPIKLAETGNPNWNGYEAMRAQGARDGQALRGAGNRQDNDGQGGAVGGASRVARVLDKSARVREGYVSDVAKLDGFDNAGRERLKGQWRESMPVETRSFLDEYKADKGPRPGSYGRANVANAKVTEQVRSMGKLGRGVGILGAAAAGVDVLQSKDRGRATVANAGAMLGGLAGGAGGAVLGGMGGPAAPVLAPAGGLAGSVAGGKYGYQAGEDLYDFLHRYFSED